MLLQAGTLILYLLTTQVTDTLGQTKTDTLLKEVTAISEQLNSIELNLKKLSSGAATEETSKLILKKLSERTENSPLEESTCIKGQPHRNGTKRVTLWGNTTTLCDTITDGGGWMLIQRRINDDTEFYRSWKDYRSFFGDLDTNFWIGNNAINRLTSEGFTELRIDMIFRGRRYYARYSNFYVAGESLKYQMLVSGYSGTAGDSMAYHNNMYFTTFDRDNDYHGGVNCADYSKGAWWYNACQYANLNGLWGVDSTAGVTWYAGLGYTSVSFTEMKLRFV